MAKIVVAGGGAAGLMAGIAAARQGASVILLEKMPEAGRKMRITGKGRCNITNSCPMEEFIPNLPGNGKFLYSAFQRFTNEDMIRLLEAQGVKIVTERGGRVFPAEGKAQEVIDALIGVFRQYGGRLETGVQVTGLILKPGRVTGVRFRRVESDGRKDGQDFRSPTRGKRKLGPEHTLDADAVIICTGGASYPGTGSDGNMLPILKRMGLVVETLLPALIYLEPEEGFTEGLEGLSLKNVQGAVLADGKVIQAEFGEMQILRGKLTGPICLTLSRKTARLAHFGQQELDFALDLKPALSEAKLEARLQRDVQEFGKNKLAEVVRKLVPRPLVEPLLDAAFLDGEKPAGSLSKKERTAFIHVLKHFTIPLTGTGPLEEAIVTSGGVSLKEIDPRTMAARRFEGLYFAGEVMDVDGYTGGFNLQAAFSSGYTAGMSAAAGIK